MNHDVAAWVDEVAKLTQPTKIHWCDGSDAEFETLKRELMADKQLLPLNPQSFPGCVLSRSDPSDVARVEHLTFVCTTNKDDAGPNNHWIAPQAGARSNGRLVRRLHARAHAVCGALLHGPDRLAVLALRR